MKKNILNKLVHIRLTKENQEYINELYINTPRLKDGTIKSKTQIINEIIQQYKQDKLIMKI